MSVPFEDIPAFDFHTHPLEAKPVSGLINRWLDVHSSVVQVDDESKTKARSMYEKQYEKLPYFQSLRRYVARKYNVADTFESVNEVVMEKNANGLTSHIQKVMDSDNVEKIIIDISGLNHQPSPNPKLDFYPSGSFVFTMGTEPWLQPKIGMTDLEEAVGEVDKVLNEALRNGCVGFKTWMAYYRSLHIEEISEERARRALRTIKEGKTEVKNRWGIDLPVGLSEDTERAIKDYQDYMIVHVAKFASEKNVPLLIHTGGAMSPSIDMRNANPLSLFSLFYNPVVRKNLPRIVMLHTGYPFHETAAAIVSEFPNAFVDLSFFTGLRGVTEKVLRSFIELVPHQKILYGSDSSTVPERLGWCATNIRESLAYVLTDFEDRYGWPRASSKEIATMILNQNTKDVLKPPGQR
jgi:hypothetical protein